MISISPALFAALHLAVRKSAHIAAYGIFAMLVYRALLPETKFRWHAPTALRTFGLAVLYAATDELHQLFVAGRGASFTDLGFDALGALLGLGLMYAYSRIRTPREIESAIR